MSKHVPQSCSERRPLPWLKQYIDLEAELHALKVCRDALVVGSILLELYNTSRVVGYTVPHSQFVEGSVRH